MVKYSPVEEVTAVEEMFSYKFNGLMALRMTLSWHLGFGNNTLVMFKRR